MTAVRRTCLALAIAVAVSTPWDFVAAEASAGAGADIVNRFLTSGAPPLVSYHARRTLSASTRGGKMAAALTARTWLLPDGTFHFEVERHSGSTLLHDHVLVAALEAEQRSRNQHETATAELTPANYEFSLLPNAAAGRVRIGLAPRRESQMLVHGSAEVTADTADLRLVEGELAKPPSFWTRRVEITRRYERIGGIRVPVDMRSRADVRIVGESTFAMTYEYESVNGQGVR